MKKLKSFICCFVLAISAFFGCFVADVSYADAVQFGITYQDYSQELSDILEDFCENKARIAGSDIERNASLYIKNYLLSCDGLVAKNDASTTDGVQAFQFLNNYTDMYSNSQNIIFSYRASNSSGKKVIFACNYDAPLTYDEEKQEYVSFNNDALNSSAGSVAAMLLLARTLPSLGLKFDAEFLFLGAGENSLAGSEFYLNGVSAEEKENILCVINFDGIALGKNIYFYIDEIETEFSKFVTKTSSAYANEIDLVNLNKSNMVDTKLNLGYSHIALNSDNVNFMSSGITTINLFAGEYETGVILGLNEYDGKDVVSYTKNDTIEYINENYGQTTIADNLYKVQMMVTNLLANEKFEAAAASSAGETKWFYNIFANERLASYLTIIAFFVVLVIAMYVYYKLSVKSYQADVEVEFLSSVVKISDQIDTGNDPDEITKVVGQVIANDIKKDNSKNSKIKEK